MAVIGYEISEVHRGRCYFIVLLRFPAYLAAIGWGDVEKHDTSIEDLPCFAEHAAQEKAEALGLEYIHHGGGP